MKSRSVLAATIFQIEGDAKKIGQIFFFIVFLIVMIMLLPICILKVHTLTIPKW